MNLYVTARKTVTVLTLVISTTFIVVIILVSTQPISLPFLSSYFKDKIDNQLEEYRVDFATVRAQWRPMKGNIDLHFYSVRAIDYKDNNLANAQKLIVEVKANSIFDNVKSIKTIELHNPGISIIRSTNATLMLDIGNTHNGSSNKVIEMALNYAKKLSRKNSQQNESAVNLRIIDSDLMLSDEITGSLVNTSNAYIDFSTDQDGINCIYKFNVFASGEYINIFGDCSYNIADGDFKLAVNLDKVRPSLLTEFFPLFFYFTPLEVQLSGIVQFEFDELLQVKKTTFDLTSNSGTLELIEALGNNLNIKSLHVTGSALKQFSHITLDRLLINLDNNTIEATALFLKNHDILDFKLNALINGSSIADLLPRWFAYLKTEQLDCIENDNNEYHHSSISIDGTYDLEKNNINALGYFKCHEKLLSINTHSSDRQLSPVINYDLNFRLDGALDTPNLSAVR